jgi:ABC-type transport system involved in cytochrome c biogenesis permease component
MRFLSVAERELRAAARRPGTYYVRWITGIAFFGLLIWLLWVYGGFRNARVSDDVFQVFSGLIFFYCLIVGTAGTADSLSAEKREGTLGLLYLTNLNSAEIVAGKLCSSALAMVYGLLAIFPILALPLLLGGITFEHFGRTVLALLSTILFSLAAGFTASAVCVRQFPAVALATGIALLGGTGLLAAAAIVKEFRGAQWVVDLLAVCCPFYPLLIADGSKMFGGNYYWVSVGVVSGLALLALTGVAGQLSRSWRDRPKVIRNARGWKFWGRQSRESRKPSDAGLRRRLLDVNPFFWLAGRNRISSPVFMVIAFVLVAITAYVTTPFFGKTFRGGNSTAMIGSLFAWVWAGLAAHGLSLYYAAMVASQRLAEDKQTGSLEMILCTPTTERSISRGLWLAFARRMMFPALFCVLVHCFFIWQCMIMGTLEHPGKLPRNTTASELFWAALWNQPIRGYEPDWAFGFMLWVLLLILGLLVMVWGTLGWVGRWLGLRMKHPGFAPALALTLVFVPPTLVFSLLCYLADEFNLDRMPERQFIPLMMWVAFGIGVLHCLFLCSWAARRLRHDFRTTVTGRFQPPSSRRWWRPSWRGVKRLAVQITVLTVTVVLIGLSFYGYHSWRSHRAWKVFQAELTQRGESLDFTKLLPASVPDESNFAKAAAFQKLLGSRDQELANFLLDRNELDNAFQRYASVRDTIEWTAQQSLPLIKYVDWFGSGPAGRTNNLAVAAPLLRRLQRYDAALNELALAAARPQFQLANDRNGLAALQSIAVEAKLLERLQFLFTVRANARLMTEANVAAGEDVLAALRLTALARQLPDAKSSLRVHVMLARACQPLWEGCVGHDWTEPQLAGFQQVLAGFDLFADHTNAIRRVMLGHIASWQAAADRPATPLALLDVEGGVASNSDWRWQPHAWWYDRCIQLYRAGRRSMARVDAAAECVRSDHDWQALNGLPLGESVKQLIEPYPYVGNVPNPTMLAFAKTALNQALLACALERHRIARGQYPEALGALVPAYLPRVPRDVITGREMIYQRLADDQFILRSVGPNGADDRKTKGADDWLWAFPTNAVPLVVAPEK